MKDFLIIGHPRSGTGYMSKLFQYFGFEVGHERVWKHGVSAWQFTVDTESIPPWCKSKRGNYDFKYIIHVVRNPKNAIPSIFYTEDTRKASREYRQFHLFENGLSNLNKKSEVSHSLASYREWNNLIQLKNDVDLTVNVESAEEKVESFLIENGYEVNKNESKKPSTNYNSRKHRDWSSIDFSGVDKNEKVFMNSFCKTYNYDPCF